jgi:TIR domain-containing protein
MNSETRQRFFRHDAFISYARHDNETGVVRALHAQLEEFLIHSLAWEPSVWLDERSLDVETDIEEQIRAGLRDSAILIVVTSETIESRKWCRLGVRVFSKNAEADGEGRLEVAPKILRTSSSPSKRPRGVAV